MEAGMLELPPWAYSRTVTLRNENDGWPGAVDAASDSRNLVLGRSWFSWFNRGIDRLDIAPPWTHAEFAECT